MLVRKLCSYTTTNATLLALFEYGRLIRRIYTLKYLRDPQLERNSGAPRTGLNIITSGLATHFAERAL